MGSGGCVDYTGLNKAFLKDPFPLPWIDQVVDSTTGYETLCFLDAYSLASVPSTPSEASGKTPSHQECMLEVTTCSRQGTEPLADPLLDPLA
jgi:hypothetical protein